MLTSKQAFDLFKQKKITKEVFIDALSDRERVMYDLVNKRPGVSAEDAAKSLGIEANNARNLLARLEGYGLVIRQEKRGTTWESQ